MNSGARDRPVSAQTFTGRSTSKFEHNFFSNAQIDISINWCVESGYMKVHKHHCRLALTILVHFSVITMQSDKGLMRRAARPPKEADSPPQEAESPS